MMRFEYRATMDDGSTLDIVADQRDVAAFECSADGVPFNLMTTRPFTFARWTAWHAGLRAGQHELTWAAWGDRCVDVTSADDKKPDENQDPGQPTASVGTSSRSVSRGGRRSTTSK